MKPARLLAWASAASVVPSIPPGYPQCRAGDAPDAAKPDTDALSGQTIRARGSSDFLAYRSPSGPQWAEQMGMKPAPEQAPAPALHQTPSCLWMEAHLNEGLSEHDTVVLDGMAENSKLVHKTSVWNMARLLQTFPSASDGIHGKGVCASTVPETPFVTTFNSRDHHFYGLMLNPERMVPVLSGTNDLYSNCRYDASLWNDADASNPARPRRWNDKNVVNVAPSGELCHDMKLSIRAISKDIAFDGGAHDYIDRGTVLRHNEIVLMRNDDDTRTLSTGLFVDLVSNAMLMTLARSGFRPLLWLKMGISNERWLQAIQIINIRRVADKPELFEKAKQLCAQFDLPFLLRTVSPAGQVSFQTVDIREAGALRDLPQIRKILDDHSDPLLTSAVTEIARLFRI